MPSRKQRRRRDKLQRHEYEYVVETEEGEVPLRELKEEGRQPKDGKEPAAGPLDRRGRPIPKPSLNRVLKRAAIFAPILVIFVYLTAGEDLEPVGVVLNAAILLAFFIPFSYLVDVILYRIMSRRAKGR
ncbi:MAG: hypothetical protein H0V20_04135 [Actinobacteria bacterium]|nr:hypothetical protein [Actinomycetota bacterium]